MMSHVPELPFLKKFRNGKKRHRTGDTKLGSMSNFDDTYRTKRKVCK